MGVRNEKGASATRAILLVHVEKKKEGIKTISKGVRCILRGGE